MTDLDREQLKRACSEALKAVQQDKGVDGLVPLAFTIADLGPAYRAHGTLNAGRAGGTEGHHGHLASGAAARRTCVGGCAASEKQEAPGWANTRGGCSGCSVPEPCRRKDARGVLRLLR